MPDVTRLPTHDAPYRGLRVLDLGQGVASPYCGMLLALYGADVVKLEPPDGDWSRRLGTTYGEHTALSAVYNRGKRGLCVDLKKPEGGSLARRMAASADVLIEGFRPGVAARLGLDYDTLRTERPGLIYVSVSGFGQAGPYADRPCTDSVAQAFAGLVALNHGADGVPHRVGTTISDISTGLYAFQAVSIALYVRAATGGGRRIDVSLTQSTAALLGHKLAEQMLEGSRPRALNVPAGAYRTRDSWIMITLVTEPQYRRLCTAIGRPDLAEDARFRDFALRNDHTEALVAQIAAALQAEETAHWLDRLQAADVIADRILEPMAWREHPQVLATQGALSIETAGIGAVHVARVPGWSVENERLLGPAPLIGQHTREVLVEAGFEPATIAALFKDGVVR